VLLKEYCHRELEFPFSTLAQELFYFVLHIDKFRLLPLFCTGRRGQKAVLWGSSGRHTWDIACSSCTNATCHTRFL
jgi:hypothetical protein